MLELGLIQVYTGNGKGKTTASLGLAFRAIGHGFKVYMLQFMKQTGDYGENKAADYLPGFTIEQAGRSDLVNLENPAELDAEVARRGWERAKELLASQAYDIVILDEINVAMAVGFLDPQMVADFLAGLKPNRTEILLTGRYAPQPILDIAHLVTEMKEIKHPFAGGVKARQGIEY